MKYDKLHVFFVICIISVLFVGCRSKQKENGFDDGKYKKISVNETYSKMSRGFDAGIYSENLNESRIPISQCKEIYSDEVKDVQSKDFGKIDFSSAVFGSFEELESVTVLTQNIYDAMSVEDGIQAFENEIKKLHLEKTVDLKKELRDSGSEVAENPDDQGEPYPYYRPSVFENKDKFSSAAFFFIATPDVAIQMNGLGFYSFSDATIPKYLDNQVSPALDAFGVSFEEAEVVESGIFSDLKDKSYELLNGSITIAESADCVLKYFQEGTPLAIADDISLEIEKVTVYKVKDIYAYAFDITRKYKGISFSYASAGNYSSPRMMAHDTKQVFTITGDSVNAYWGTNPAKKMKSSIEEQTSILSMEQAAYIADTALAKNVQAVISSVDFQYVSLYLTDNDGATFPCWKFSGKSTRDNRNINIYVDALTGETFYETFVNENN